MRPRRILLVGLLLAAAFAFSSLILPGVAASIYVSIMQPLTLFLGSVLAFKVTSIYEKELKKSFLFLSFFLVLYMLANIFVLWQFLYSLVGNSTVFLIQFLQIADYAMLITSCIYTIRVIDVRRMNRYGWISLGMMFPLSVYIVAYQVPFEMNEFSVMPLVAMSRMMIYVFDMSIVLMLVPVLFLYLQYLRAKAQESATFMMIMGGIILSLFSTYIFQLVMGLPLDIIAAMYSQKGSVLDATYIFGYVIVAAGLYAHRKYDEWGYMAIDKALTGKRKLVN